MRNEFEEIVEGLEELRSLGAEFPGREIVIEGEDGSYFVAPLKEFLSLTEAFVKGLKIPNIHPSAFMVPMAELNPLFIRGVWEYTWQEFHRFMLNDSSYILQSALFDTAELFIRQFRALAPDPAIAHIFWREAPTGV